MVETMRLRCGWRIINVSLLNGITWIEIQELGTQRLNVVDIKRFFERFRLDHDCCKKDFRRIC